MCSTAVSGNGAGTKACLESLAMGARKGGEVGPCAEVQLYWIFAISSSSSSSCSSSPRLPELNQRRGGTVGLSSVADGRLISTGNEWSAPTFRERMYRLNGSTHAAAVAGARSARAGAGLGAVAAASRSAVATHDDIGSEVRFEKCSKM